MRQCILVGLLLLFPARGFAYSYTERFDRLLSVVERLYIVRNGWKVDKIAAERPQAVAAMIGHAAHQQMRYAPDAVEGRRRVNALMVAARTFFSDLVRSFSSGARKAAEGAVLDEKKLFENAVYFARGEGSDHIARTMRVSPSEVPSVYDATVGIPPRSALAAFTEAGRRLRLARLKRLAGLRARHGNATAQAGSAEGRSLRGRTGAASGRTRSRPAKDRRNAGGKTAAGCDPPRSRRRRSLGIPTYGFGRPTASAVKAARRSGTGGREAATSSALSAAAANRAEPGQDRRPAAVEPPEGPCCFVGTTARADKPAAKGGRPGLLVAFDRKGRGATALLADQGRPRVLFGPATWSQCIDYVKKHAPHLAADSPGYCVVADRSVRPNRYGIVEAADGVGVPGGDYDEIVFGPASYARCCLRLSLIDEDR